MSIKLTPRQNKFVAEYLSGKNAEQAALAAGYTKASARTRSYELLHQHPLIMKAIEVGQAEIRKQANYDAARAMDELDVGIRFAEATKNATAYLRGVELKAKLMGLLTEKKESSNAAFRINILGLDSSAPTIIAERE